MTDNLTAAYNKMSANKIAFLYENLDKAFKELAYEMTKFASIDPDVHATYKKMLNDFLIKAMQERMEPAPSNNKVQCTLDFRG